MKLFLLISLITLAPKSWSANSTVTVKNCKFTFETTGSPTLVRISGKSGNDCSGSLTHDGAKVVSSEFTMALDKIDTGIPLRNKHLRENYLHVDKFPTAKLKVTNLENLKEQLAGNTKKANKLEGVLELHGKESPILDGSYEISGKSATIKFGVDLPQHGVDRPSFMGVKIVDRVNSVVTLDF